MCVCECRLLSDSSRLTYRAAEDCQAVRLRGMLATIDQQWIVDCPSTLSDDVCYFDCNERPLCLHGLALVLESATGAGSWHRVPLPADWTAFSLLFESSLTLCGSDEPLTACIQLEQRSAPRCIDSRRA